MAVKDYRKYYKRKYLLQIRERILLFLDNFVGIYDQPQLPFSLTQSGIARSLDIRRSQVSQVISKLLEDGCVSSELRHIQGGKRRRICYFLTSQGMNDARQIESRIGNEPIELLGVSGAAKTVSLYDIPAILGDGSTLLDVVTHVRKSVFDVASYQKKMKHRRKRVTFVSRLPAISRFYGRRKELKRIRDFLKSKQHRILTIKGIAGIGKSTLAAKILKEKKAKTNLFYHQLEEWSTLRSVLLSFSKLLSKMDRNDLKFYLESNKEIDVHEVGLIIEESLRGIDGLIVLDDCQKAKEDVLSFLESSKDYLTSSNGFKMIVLGRRVPPFYDRRDVTLRKFVAEMELSGLLVKDCREFLSSRKLPKSMHNEIIKRTEGHPLFLELVDSSSEIVAGDVKKFLKQEIFAKLGDKERTLLSVASVFRRPVSATAFFAEEKLDHEAIDSLVSQSLLSEDAHGMYVVHDTVKEFFYGRLPKAKKTLYHLCAGEYYCSFSDPASVLEAEYHLVEAGEFERAAELVALQGENLIREGYSERLLNILEEMKDPRKWGAFRTEVFLLKGRLLNIVGRWKDAIGSFKEAGRTAVREDDIESQLEASGRIGEVLRKHGRNEEALEVLLEAEKDVVKEMDVSVVAEVYRNLALSYANEANYDDAYRYLNLLDERTAEHPGQPVRADFLAARAIILSLQGLHKEAYEVRNEAAEICEENHDVLRLAGAYNGLGLSLYHLDENDLAFEYFDRAIKFARRIGDLRTQAYLLYNAASTYIEKPNLHKAQEYLQSAESIFDRLEDQKMIAAVNLSHAFVSFGRGEYEKAAKRLGKHLAQIEEYGTRADRIESHRLAGELYDEMGLKQEAMKCFELALSYSEKFGRSEAFIKSLRELTEKSRLP